MKKLLLALAVALTLISGAAAAAINVNTASADELAQLDGIGEVKATAIVEDREANGDYTALDDMTRVTGIGNKTVDGLRDGSFVLAVTPECVRQFGR